jgi:hypothetical protein
MYGGADEIFVPWRAGVDDGWERIQGGAGLS